MKTVAFRTFGCRLNQYDTETVRTLLEQQGGWRSVPASSDPQVFVVNTCSVTAQADATARKAIRRIHREHPDSRIVVTGCYAQRAPDELAELPGVSLIVGAANRAHVSAKLDEVIAKTGPVEVEIAVSPISEARTFIDVPISEMMEHSRAYVKVQEGCDQACSFCIVPQTRGRSRSRSRESVLAQARELITSGYVEIVLTGVHIGDYGLDLEDGQRQLAGLISDIIDLPGLQRFRLSSIEPSSISDDLIELMASRDRFARHFHIPFQSGSDSVLTRMRRGYRADEFCELVERIADKIPECGIGCDVICGFPGESDEDFQHTFDCLEQLPITYLHPFSFSPRPGSEAETFSDQINPEDKKRRITSLKRLMRDKNQRFREQHIGRVIPVLIENGRRHGEANMSGWSDNYLKVELGPGTADPVIADVRITGLTADGLSGEFV